MEIKIFCRVPANMPVIISIFTLFLLLNFLPVMGGNRHTPISSESSSAKSDQLKIYVVHVNKPDSSVFSKSEDRESWYRSFLPTSIANSDDPRSIIYSYHNVMSGFAAKLTENDVKTMEAKQGFVSAREERILHLQTTHSPNFLGLHPEMGFWKDSNFGQGVIIGVLDTGVLPSHPSFSEEGMPPPPAKWKGKCDFDVSVCNKKIIGARSFNGSTMRVLPIDTGGHGTHTASTAAGNFVKNANALGSAFGTAAGMAPYAHLAIYKVCSGEDCSDVDILAGLDAAVEDGVDVLSLSIGDVSMPFYQDVIAIGSFAAIQKGIFVSCAGGNSGPANTTLSNEAPWILTVGASTTDRSLRAIAKLGNSEEFYGESVFQPKDFSSTLLPLVDAGVIGANKADAAFCSEGSLNGTDVKGKVVLCLSGGNIARIAKGKEVKNAGGAAMILMNDEVDGYSTIADTHVLPVSHISFADGIKIKAYINSTSTPMATIVFKGTVIAMSLAPSVTSFSSRGPNFASPGILKPDIIGPGVSILAAWPFSLDSTNSSALTFNVISGTSMSCPHLSGIAALLKSLHPDWSPAAIKSSIMTTADLFNLEGKPITDETMKSADFFAVGAGHVNPSKANFPGLVYDIKPEDYIPYLCGLGYTDEQVSILAHGTIKCSYQSSIVEGELNYPSFSVKLGSAQTFTREVTNVGEPHSTYMAQIVAPQGVEVIVKPDTLYFSNVNQKLTFSVTFTKTSASTGSSSSFAQGFLKWVSSKYVVRSPISVKFV